MKTRRIAHEFGEIVVLDELFDDPVIERAHDQIMSRAFRRHEYDDEQDRYPIFSTELSRPDLTDKPLFRHICSARDYIHPQRAFELRRAYVNLCTYGDMEYPHQDSTRPGDLTILYYVNKSWDPTWGGETLFYDRDLDTMAAVQPRPGRVVMFPGRIHHVGTIPTRICAEARLTMALKFRALP